MKQMRKKQKKDATGDNDGDESGDDGSDDGDAESTSAEQTPEEIVRELKATLVNDTNMQAVKDKMKATIQHRKDLIADKSISALFMFPYLFAASSSHLVCKFFLISYKFFH